MYRHANIDNLQRVARDFTRALRDGQFEEARQWTLVTFQNRYGVEEFRTLATEVGLDQGPCELIEASTSFPEGGNLFVSEYLLRCGSTTEQEVRSRKIAALAG